MPVLLVSNHMVQHRLAILRDQRTRDGRNDQAFYKAGYSLSHQLIEAAVGEYGPSMLVTITTPLADASCKKIPENKLAFIAIRRAGLVLAKAAHELFPDATQGVIDLHRNETTLEPIEGLLHDLPLSLSGKTVFLLDPMLATGGSAAWGIRRLQELGAERVIFVGWVSAPPGFDRIRREYPDVPIVLAACDPTLNKVGYIVPGLGDAGDRLFGPRVPTTTNA